MGNHYHLLLECPDGGLSPFMQRVGSMYTRYVNHRIGSDGPIFRGRFRSLLVDTEEYLVCAARYIHRNPLDRRPSAPLTDDPWSSYGAYVGRVDPPAWLATGALLARHGGVRGLREFVETEAGAERLSAEWVVDTALLVCGDDEAGATPHLRRALTVALFDRLDGRLRAELARVLRFPSRDAERAAVSRSRRRVAADPVFAGVVEVAVSLSG
jgi:REP-associated tyrosine transposase